MGIVYNVPVITTIPSTTGGYKSYNDLTSEQKAIVDNISSGLHFANYDFGYVLHYDYYFASDMTTFAGCQISTNEIYLGFYGTEVTLVRLSKKSEGTYSIGIIHINGYHEIDDKPNGTVTFLLNGFSSKEEVRNALVPQVTYPITYSYSNSVVNGPSEAAVGDTVTVSAVPDVGYGITDASTQILVTNNDVAVPYTWDAVNQRITFTMPDPS